MATYTSTQTGPWSDADTWGGVAAPVAGDTVTVAAGHTVTCDAATNACGNVAGTADPALTIVGAVIVPDTCKLILTSTTQHIQLEAGGTLDVDAGGVLELDATGAAFVDSVFDGVLTVEGEIRVRAGVTTSSGTDLYHSIAASVLANGTLNAAFGNAAWFYLDEAPPDTNPPVCILSDDARTIERPFLDRGSDRPGWITGTFSLVTFATSRTSARTLGRAVAAAIEASALAGTLTLNEATAVDVERSGSELTSLDDVTAPDGSDLWRHEVELTYLSAEN
jgi:hypothetical protein